MALSDNILKKIKDWAATKEGKAAIKSKYGVNYDPDFSVDEAQKYGEQMRDIMLEYIRPVIDTITAEDIVVGEPKHTKDGMVLTVSFVKDKLKRDSLYTDEYDGVDDIVLLMTKGYHAKNYAYGWWYRPKSTWYGGDDFVRVVSRKDREPNDFMYKAVEKFNEKTDGNIVAILSDNYKIQ